MDKEAVLNHLKATLGEVKQSDFSSVTLSQDLVGEFGLDSIEFIEVLFKLENKIKKELEFQDLVRFCRTQENSDVLKVRLEFVVNYILQIQQ